MHPENIAFAAILVESGATFGSRESNTVGNLADVPNVVQAVRYLIVQLSLKIMPMHLFMLMMSATLLGKPLEKMWNLMS